MFSSITTFISNRRRGLAKVAGIAGALYLARQFITERLDDIKERIEQERVARDTLKRRFDETQGNISYTVLALMQTLAEQVLGQMDVEGLTRELQSRSKARKAARAIGAGVAQVSGLREVETRLVHEQERSREDKQEQDGSRPPSSLASSVDVVGGLETASEAGSSMMSSYHVAEHSEGVGSNASAEPGVGSWVEAGTTSSLAPVDGVSAGAEVSVEVSLGVREMIHNGDAPSVTESGMTDSVMSSSFTSDASNTRTTADLWNEVKILTFTRTLTTLYSTILLSLLTTLQLTLLARGKYVQAIVAKERDERMRDVLASQLTLTNIMLGRTGGLEELMSPAMGEDGTETEGVSEEVESMFLTMSWWILHVGWKDVGERVRRGVEEVFDGVSLKSKLSAMDLHRLVSDVRRRVEYEVTFEGRERRIDFISSLLPSTPETVQHVLTQGGFPSRQPPYTHLDLLEFDMSSTTSSLSAALPQHSHQLTSSFISSYPPPSTSPSPSPRPTSPHLDTTTTTNNPAAPPTQTIHPLPLHPNAPFAALLAETHATLASPDFAHVLGACLDRAAEVLSAGLEREVFVGVGAGEQDMGTSGSGVGVGEPVRIRLAGMLPGLARWSERALVGLPNELVDGLLDMREVECLSAIVFARFEDQFR